MKAVNNDTSIESLKLLPKRPRTIGLITIYSDDHYPALSKIDVREYQLVNPGF